MINDEIATYIYDMLTKQNIVEHYSDYYSSYVSNTKNLADLIKKYDPDNFETFKKYREKIMKIYRTFVKGNIQTASSIMTNYFFSKDGFAKYCENSMKDCTFYRGRTRENYSENFELALFHIPFNKRELTRNERFSISGFPCLYLADSINCCCSELDNVDIRIAKYTLTKSIRYYDLMDLNYKEEKKINLFYKKTLLVYAMSFVVEDNNTNCFFKTNYVVPQLLTSAISSQLLKKSSSVEKRCIKYRSVKYANGVNYLFIPKSDNKRNKLHDIELMEKFRIEEIDCSVFSCNEKNEEGVL